MADLAGVSTEAVSAADVSLGTLRPITPIAGLLLIGRSDDDLVCDEVSQGFLRGFDIGRTDLIVMGIEEQSVGSVFPTSFGHASDLVEFDDISRGVRKLVSRSEDDVVFDDISQSKLITSVLTGQSDDDVELDDISQYRRRIIARTSELLEIDSVEQGSIPVFVLIGQSFEDVELGETLNAFLQHAGPGVVRDDAIGMTEISIGFVFRKLVGRTWEDFGQEE